jgi:hypothetical protein
VNRREWRWLAWTGLALMLASNLPYLVAWAATPRDATFTGLIFNPQDGHSYIAKMRQGLEGSWRFHLPYTPERHDGVAVYLFHLLLGHIARWTGLSIVGIYHAARILSGGAMLVAIYALTSYLSRNSRERGTMFLLTSLGSGLGWLVGASGTETADLWVPEAFPFYSLMANAHFPLAIGLMVGIVMCGLYILEAESRRERQRSATWLPGAAMALGAALLGIIQPFGLVPAFGGLGITLVAGGLRERSFPWRAFAWIVGAAALALPYPLYMQLAIRSDPILAAWSARNVTSSPPLWNWALSYGSILVLAVLGCGTAIRRRSYADCLLLGWVLVTLIGMYLPLPLQRRLSLGLGAPMGLLAGLGWCRSVRGRIGVRIRPLMDGLIVAFGALTPIFLIALASFSALTGDPWFYLSSGERAALTWLRDHGQSDGVVLCAPQTGAFVPAWAGQRVVYGHPFETVDAERRKAKVVAYWSGEMSPTEQETFLRENRVRYVMVGPRERALGAGGQSSLGTADVVLEVDDVRVYAINGR